MKRKTLKKDTIKCFKKSKGRFISIISLIALGSFALVGLQITGSDMRKTGENYFNKYNPADVTIIGDLGIDKDNRKVINKISNAQDIEYGYLKDVVIKDSNTSIRIFSKTDKISQYELVKGNMPSKNNEICIASYLKDRYKIGDNFKIEELEDISGNKVLKYNTYKVVGYVNSSEILSSINMGQSTAGDGELKGYALVNEDAFDSDYYMLARITFKDTKGIDPYSDKYTDLVSEHKKELEELLKDQPTIRLTNIKKEYNEEIDEAQDKIDNAKKKLSDSYNKLTNGDKQLKEAKEEYNQGLNEYNSSKAKANKELSSAKATIDANQKKLNEAKNAIKNNEEKLNNVTKQLQASRKVLDTKWKEYNDNVNKIGSLESAKSQLDKAQSQIDTQIAAVEKNMGMSIEEIEKSLSLLKNNISNDQYQQICLLINSNKEIMKSKKQYNQLLEAKNTLDISEKKYKENKKQIEQAKAKLNSSKKELKQKETQLNQAINQYNTNKTKVNKQLKEAKAKLDKANTEIGKNEKELNKSWSTYYSKQKDANKEIKKAQDKVDDAKEQLNDLEEPVYSIDTRREIPGGEGYRIYSSVSNIIDALGNVFPIFFYFIAALVTLTTMTRFVDEERINCGTLKALGYSNFDIEKKFIVYGLIAGTVGAVIGIISGHIIIPLIAYNAYGKSFTYPNIELHFYPEITVISFILALLCTVLPAYIVATKNLKEKPTVLLQPKAPESGSKILLEYITPIWDRLSFTHKVTARNIFRYKKRMLMTIFGVCGSVTLILAGFSVQHSIQQIEERQFHEIMNYDLIVAKNDCVTSRQQNEIDNLLSSDKIKQQISIHYEVINRKAGKSKDDQEIKLIVSNNEIANYIKLNNRKTNKKIKLDNNGCVISERLADLINVKEGDTFTFKDKNKRECKVKVSGITEMYTGHFMFMNNSCYEEVFSKKYSTNAYIISLKDNSINNVKLQASNFIELDGIEGVVQNSSLINQINTIVNSLNKIMKILIVVAILLAIVILYNLTNINICERIRELSTIKVLGFYDNEVTMYIYRETILLTIFGILLGYLFGDALFLYIIKVVPPDETMFNPTLGVKAFIIPVIVITIITFILAIITNNRLKNVDMLEALKSVE